MFVCITVCCSAEYSPTYRPRNKVNKPFSMSLVVPSCKIMSDLTTGDYVKHGKCFYYCSSSSSKLWASNPGGNGSFRLPLFEGYRYIKASSIPKRINVFSADVY